MNTRMWIIETDQYGATDRKFSVDEPLAVPRQGEFVDSDAADGWVNHVQYYYSSEQLVVNVFLSEAKQ
jgi:hypothetical protein